MYFFHTLSLRVAEELYTVYLYEERKIIMPQCFIEKGGENKNYEGKITYHKRAHVKIAFVCFAAVRRKQNATLAMKSMNECTYLICTHSYSSHFLFIFPLSRVIC